MKITVYNPKQNFEPIELTIIIESKEELSGLYTRLSINQSAINKTESHDNLLGVEKDELYTFYNAINKICDKL